MWTGYIVGRIDNQASAGASAGATATAQRDAIFPSALVSAVAPALVFGAIGAFVGAWDSAPGKYGIAGAAIGAAAGIGVHFAIDKLTGGLGGPPILKRAINGAATAGGAMGAVTVVTALGLKSSASWGTVLAMTAAAAAAGAICGGIVGGGEMVVGHLTN